MSNFSGVTPSIPNVQNFDAAQFFEKNKSIIGMGGIGLLIAIGLIGFITLVVILLIVFKPFSESDEDKKKREEKEEKEKKEKEEKEKKEKEVPKLSPEEQKVADLKAKYEASKKDDDKWPYLNAQWDLDKKTKPCPNTTYDKTKYPQCAGKIAWGMTGLPDLKGDACAVHKQMFLEGLCPGL